MKRDVGGPSERQPVWSTFPRGRRASADREPPDPDPLVGDDYHRPVGKMVPQRWQVGDQHGGQPARRAVPYQSSAGRPEATQPRTWRRGSRRRCRLRRGRDHPPQPWRGSRRPGTTASRGAHDARRGRPQLLHVVPRRPPGAVNDRTPEPRSACGEHVDRRCRSIDLLSILVGEVEEPLLHLVGQDHLPSRATTTTQALYNFQ